MRIALPILLSTTALIGAASDGSAHAQASAVPAVEGALTAVAYVEVKAASAAVGRTALKQYRDALGKVPSSAGVELFEQSARTGHFAIVETWRDQAAFDARDSTARSRLMDALAPIRVSGYDERTYKNLATAKAAAVPSRGTLYVITHVDVVPNPQAADMLTHLANASRKDDGNLRFDVVQFSQRPNHFTVIEQWRDQKALDTHVAAAHTRQYRDDLQPLTGSPLDERVYTAVE
jgi:quinol monooxygenase YgiN